VNVELARAAGARLLFGAVETRELLDDAVAQHAEELRAQGRRPYAVPRGGATAVGVFGYVQAARELDEQCRLAGMTPGTVVLASGSGGTQAGLVAGRAGLGLPWRVVGAGVSRPAAELSEQVLRLAGEGAAALSLPAPSAADVDVRDCRGPGFGIASAEDRVSARIALEHEGLLLDDYYGAKAMTLLRTLRSSDSTRPTVFWHTGGVAAALSALSTRAGRAS
jgi:D-cysteine desulfhydrase